jgi:tetratricopeptide (TPR) repeat protein
MSGDMLKRPITLCLFFFCCWNLSAQILKTDSVQKARLFGTLTLKQKYTPKVDISKVDADDYENLVAKGIALYEAENFKDAYILFKLADDYIEKHVANRNLRQVEKSYTSMPLFLMALCEIKLEHEAQAFTLLNSVIEKDPINVDAYDELGLLYAAQLKYDSAIIQFKKAIAINARFEKAYYNLAYTLYLKKNVSSAKTTLFNLIAINPSNEQYHLFYAVLNEESKWIVEAEKEYSAAIAANLSNGRNYYHRGAFWLRQKKYREAAIDFRLSFQKDTTDVESLSGLTAALMLNSEFEEGTIRLLQFVERQDTSSSIFKMDLSLVEMFEILKVIHGGSMDSLEKRSAIKLVGLIYNGVKENQEEIGKVVGVFPKSEIMVRLYFLSLFVSGMHEQFKYQAYKLYAINDNLPNTYMMEACLSDAANSNPKRIIAVKKAISLNAKNPTYYYVLALLSPLDDYNCRLNIDKTLAIDPKFDRAYIAMGNIYQYKEQHDSALYYYRLGIKNTNSKVEGYYLIGSCYLTMNRRDSALFYLTKTIRLHSGSYDAYLKRSSAYVLYEQFENAHKDIDTILNVYPTSVDALDQRALIFTKEKKYDQALKIYGSLVKKYPNVPILFLKRGNVYFEMKKYDAALSEFKTTLSYWPYHTTALRRTGYTYLMLKDSGSANYYYKKILENKKGGFINDYLYSASVLTEAGYYDEAINYYGYALKSDSKNISANGNLGWVYYKKGDFESCIKHSKMAVEYDSLAMFAKFNIALCKLRLGHIEQAKSLYKEYTEQSIRMGFPKPNGAIQDLKDMVALNIYITESQIIINEIIDPIYK